MVGQQSLFNDPADLAAGVSLLEYTQLLTRTIVSNPRLGNVWVRAELSDLRVSAGHCYMELVEKDDAGRTVAKLRATIWASLFPRVRDKFASATGAQLCSGLKVMVCGSAAHHSVYGLSFNISDIDPSYTMGDLERRRREILEALRKAGVLDRNKQLQLPYAPQKIAVVTSETAAGYGDFIDQLLHNPYGFQFYPHLFAATVQGERTSATVRQALAKIEESIDFWDAVVIIRGGGATTDLIDFDDLELAKAVACFPLPIIVGIGHERDRTVLDEIAHTRCKTPTAVAGFLVDRLLACNNHAMQLATTLKNFVTERLRGEERHLSSLTASVPVVADAVIGRQRQRLTSAAALLQAVNRNAIGVQGEKLRQIGERMALAARNLLQRQEVRLANLRQMTAALSPQATLNRGYSITRVDGKAVADPAALKPGTLITTLTAKGEISSKVI